MNLLAYFDKQYLKKLRKQALTVIELEDKYKTFSDDDLREKTKEFKNLLQNGETIDEIKVDAAAVVREASSRVLGLKHYTVQIMGGLALLEGDIAEMATGEII